MSNSQKVHLREEQGHQTRNSCQKGSVPVLFQPSIFVVGNVFIPLQHFINEALLISFQKVFNKVVRLTFFFSPTVHSTWEWFAENRKIASLQNRSVGMNGQSHLTQIPSYPTLTFDKCEPGLTLQREETKEETVGPYFRQQEYITEKRG